MVTKLNSNRWLIHTTCHECFIDVEVSENDTDVRWLTINLLSTHQGKWEGRLRTRLRYAWNVLLGQGWSAFEFISLEEVDALIDTLNQAKNEAFVSKLK